METTIDPEEARKQEILALQRKQTVGGVEYTDTDRKRLLELTQPKPEPGKFFLTQAHKNALQRQTLAGQAGIADLTDEERRLIKEATKMI